MFGDQADQADQAAAALALLLNEDPTLLQYNLTTAVQFPDDICFAYASKLLIDFDNEHNQQSAHQRASSVLKDIGRKLTLVESLSVKLSRTSPEVVAGNLLCLHGFDITVDSHSYDIEEEDISKLPIIRRYYNGDGSNMTSLASIRDRVDRIDRQAETLDVVSKRVENSLSRGLVRMETATTRLRRVLSLSSTLKQMIRLQFEISKLQTYDFDDLRDLTRAAASVSVLENLLGNSGSLSSFPNMDGRQCEGISIVDHIRPLAIKTAASVRLSSSVLLNDLLRASFTNQASDTSMSQMIQKLGGTLQVCYHLGDLCGSVWKVVDYAHNQAEAASRNLFNAGTITGFQEKAKRASKDSRGIPGKIKQARTEAAQEWANGVLLAASLVRSLSRVLKRTTDHVHRVVYINVVATSPVPATYSNCSFDGEKSKFSLFRAFWRRLCNSLSDILLKFIDVDSVRLMNDVTALYPSVRVAAQYIVAQIHGATSILSPAVPSLLSDEAFSTSAGACGALGGSILLDDLHATVLGEILQSTTLNNTWTQDTSYHDTANLSKILQSHPSTSVPNFSINSNSFEWKTMEGNNNSKTGIYRLQRSFLLSCKERLCAPLHFMFPSNSVAVDDDGISGRSGPSLLPSKYDIQRFDESIRNELAVADPREGSDLTLVAMITESVVEMILEFCSRIKNSMSRADGEHLYLCDDLSPSDVLDHDRSLIDILYIVRNCLLQVPEKTFLIPHRPSVSPRSQEASILCRNGLAAALLEIDQTAKTMVLSPLSRALNRQISSVLWRIGHGVYLESKELDGEYSPGYIQSHLAPMLESIARLHLANFPSSYACFLADRLVTFSVYTYISVSSLIRPFRESTRLHITQDLADLEMALEQVVARTELGNLSQVDKGKPYAELRAVRQLFYWNGLEGDLEISAHEVARTLLRELWLKDIRSSTVFHYLFSYGPSLLSSPHHAKRMKQEDYVSTLVTLDASIVSGEELAWMTVMSCCDTYQQRTASTANSLDGDPRIAQIVVAVGQELMRRRRV